MGVDLDDSLKEIEDTRWCHARFRFFESFYTHHLTATKSTDGDNEQVIQHITYALRSYLLHLVVTSKFVDKSSYYEDVVYLRYFSVLEKIHEYNWGPIIWFTCTPS